MAKASKTGQASGGEKAAPEAGSAPAAQDGAAAVTAAVASADPVDATAAPATSANGSATDDSASEDGPPAGETSADAPPSPAPAELLPVRALPDRPAGEASPAPGVAPPGDSRSLRRQHDGGVEFCLIYRSARDLIVRRGPVGVWGEVSVTQYPSEARAATAYAHACSNLVAEGFRDFRD